MFRFERISLEVDGVAQRHPIVIAYHLVWTAYGTWLPNDPRGSGSTNVVTPWIAELGELHYGRRTAQPPRQVVHQFYEQAEERLQFPLLLFESRQIEAIAEAFEKCIAAHRYTCYACAILPDHAHLVIRKHRDRAEVMIDNLQISSREHLLNQDLVPAPHPVWTLGGWKTFIDSPDHVRTAIRYVLRNPTKSSLPLQKWNFVRPYDGWPFVGRK